MGILSDEATEERLAQSLKFVKVTVEASTIHEGCVQHAGYLTDVSVAMLMVEMKRNGLVVTNGERNSG